ncbi:hypothetical protein HWV62_34261 [Athelia sp. TMB]|nr:hypothetical protein HWV62_34261 [Athelia sp. TMB]
MNDEREICTHSISLPTTTTTATPRTRATTSTTSTTPRTTSTTSTTAMDTEPQPAPIAGLVYPPAFDPSAFPTLPLPPPPSHSPSPPSPTPPPRLLPLPAFRAYTLAAALAHAPDHVLFPFLHGLEGANPAQRAFFRGRDADAPPRFRGLVCVVAEDDLAPELRASVNGGEGGPEDSDSDFYESSEEDYADMEVDGEACPGAGNTESMDVEINTDMGDTDPNAGAHMHPVAQRPAPSALHIPPTPAPIPQQHDRRPSSASLSSSSSGDSAPDDAASVSTAATSYVPGSPLSACGSGAGFEPLLEGVASPSPASIPPPTPSPSPKHEETETEKASPLLTSTFRPKDLLREVEGGWAFVPPAVPEGISLRNFGIQVPIYATLSDIVVYSPNGASPAARALAAKFAQAVQRKYDERAARLASASASAPAPEKKGAGLRIDTGAGLSTAHANGTTKADGEADDAGLVRYNVFVLDATAAQMAAPDGVPHLLQRPVAGPCGHHAREGTAAAAVRAPAHVSGNTVDLAAREKEEMRELTRASEIISVLPAGEGEGEGEGGDYSASSTRERWAPRVGQVFLGNLGDVPLARDPGPHTNTNMNTHANGGASADPFEWRGSNDPRAGAGFDVCVECHELAPFPTTAHMRAADEHLAMLDAMWAARCKAEGTWGGEGEGGEAQEIPVRPPPNANAIIHLPFPSSPPATAAAVAALLPFVKFLERLVQPPAPPSANGGSANANANGSANGSGRRWTSLFPASAPRSRSSTTPSAPYAPRTPHRTRALKVLLYSADGYTESSVPALCLLMARGLRLPEAYLALQVAKKRSFFVYPGDLPVLRRVEARLESERERGGGGGGGSVRTGASVVGKAGGWPRFAHPGGFYAGAGGRASASASTVSVVEGVGAGAGAVVPSQPRRARASTSPWLPSLFEDHQAWFSDPRFDGSFPSRVLPFLYLGNLNHASNAYMLHALGITHVVSVGECALVPPTHGDAGAGECHRGGGGGAHFVPGTGPGGQGSLWIEEREGRIKVLDIKGVCDDGIDTLEPQLAPVCDWIEKARREGGQVLVHCRVGVSRSATVTIAYVMKHLGVPLVDAYLIVRSRRLSVLIQPNMRLLYNLCGWEVKLARERAGDDEDRLRAELARALSWPYLSQEVHKLNEKYLH